SAPAITASSAEAVNPCASSSAIASSDRSSTWDRPALRSATTPALTSSPVTSYPARTAACTRGRPTYPSPTTTNFDIPCASPVWIREAWRPRPDVGGEQLTAPASYGAPGAGPDLAGRTIRPIDT